MLTIDFRFIFATFLYKLLNEDLVTCKYVSASKAWFEIFYQNVSQALPGDKVGKDYGSLCDLFFKFQETFKSWRYEHLPKIFYLLILSKLCAWEYWQMEIAFKEQFQCILLEIQA